MMVGETHMSPQGIFEIDSAYCSHKKFYLYVMVKLFELDATVKAMNGRSIDSVQTRNFKQKFIDADQHHIRHCGCPPFQTPKQMKNLQYLVSQPTPTLSGEV